MTEPKKIASKKPLMSKEEENIQRALGTLNRFEVSVERKKATSSFARVYVTAADEETAKRRALELIKEESNDDTGQPVSWADNQEGKTGKPSIDAVRFIPEDDYMAHRFNKDFKGDEDEDVDPAIFGTVM